MHTVERGNMPLSTPASGSISSLQPPRALVTLSDAGKACKPGQSVAAVPGRPESSRAIRGKVIETKDGKCEVEFAEPFPATATLGKQIDGMVQVSELQDVVFFARPADAKSSSETYVFVIEPGDQYAKRVRVRYGEMSGPMIQILSGLSPGDRVIVTDMSQWITNQRVRLQ